MLENGVLTKVQNGMYFGWTKADMRDEYARYKAELARSGSRLTGSTVNGNSFSFGPRGDMTLQQWGRSIRYALSQVDPDYIAPSGSIGVRFGCGVD